jgi:hypothetical protein
MSDPVVPVVPPVAPVAPVVPPVASVEPPKEPQTFSLEYVKELRAESKGYRLKLSETEQKAQAAEAARDAAKAEADKKISDASAAADQRIIRAELKAAALKAGMVDLDGLKLADLTKVKMNDKGEIEGADALMDEMKKAKPYLFGTVSTSSTHTAPPADKNTPKLAKDMTSEEYAAAKRKAGIRGR